jgi:hypothetical protein
MAAIKKDSISPSVIELPQIIANKYYNASAGSGPSRLTASPTGITIISPQDFHLYITTTTFTKSSMTNIGNQLQTRTDSTNAYQCVELDPDEVDSNKNIHIDLQTGNISGTVLKDILEERAILKEMVNPGADPAALKTKAQAQEASAIILVLIIILGTIGGLYWFIFREDQNATVIKQTNRFFAEMGLSVVIGILLFAAAVMRIVSKDTAMHTNSYIVGGVGLGMAFLFFLWFFVLFPQLTKTECGRAAIDLARGATGASVATGTGTAVANPVTPAPTTLSFLQPYINNGVQMGIVAAIFTFVGFIVGNII